VLALPARRRSPIVEDGDFCVLGDVFFLVTTAQPTVVELEGRQLPRAFANRLHVDDPSNSETSEFADPLPAEHGTLQIAGGLGRVSTPPAVPDVKVARLTLVECHPHAIVLDDNLPALAALLGQRDPYVGSLRVPRVGY